MTIRKREYVSPQAKVFVINAEEQLAAECGGGSSFTITSTGCTEFLVNGQGEAACTHGTVQGS